MPRYRSDSECSSCHEHMVWDSENQTLTCKCGSFHYSFVNLNEFHQIPLDALQKTLEH